jgi:transketolase
MRAETGRAAPGRMGAAVRLPTPLQFPAEADELIRRSRGELPADFVAKADAYIAAVAANGETIASRKASQLAIERLRAAAAGTDRRFG